MIRFVLLGLCLVCACGTSGGRAPDGAGTVACLDRPTDLPRSPGAGTLPCDLLPPR
jgi:hypothetical protein